MASDVAQLKRRMTMAKRELVRAVERASTVDLRRGHYVEAARRARACRDAADDLIRVLDAKRPS
jgi:hypothetical protein